MTLDQLTALMTAAQIAAANAQKWAIVAARAAEMVQTASARSVIPAPIDYREARAMLAEASARAQQRPAAPLPLAARATIAQQEPASVERTMIPYSDAREIWLEAIARAQDTAPGESPAETESPLQAEESDSMVSPLPDKQVFYISNIAAQHAAAELTIRTPRPEPAPAPEPQQDRPAVMRFSVLSDHMYKHIKGMMSECDPVPEYKKDAKDLILVEAGDREIIVKCLHGYSEYKETRILAVIDTPAAPIAIYGDTLVKLLAELPAERADFRIVQCENPDSRRNRTAAAEVPMLEMKIGRNKTRFALKPTYYFEGIQQAQKCAEIEKKDCAWLKKTALFETSRRSGITRPGLSKGVIVDYLGHHYAMTMNTSAVALAHAPTNEIGDLVMFKDSDNDPQYKPHMKPFMAEVGQPILMTAGRINAREALNALKSINSEHVTLSIVFEGLKVNAYSDELGTVETIVTTSSGNLDHDHGPRLMFDRAALMRGFESVKKDTTCVIELRADSILIMQYENLEATGAARIYLLKRTTTDNESEPPPADRPTPASVESEQVTAVTESPATDEQPAATIAQEEPATPPVPPPAYDPAADMPRRIMARLEAIENDPAAYVSIMNVTSARAQWGEMRVSIEQGKIIIEHPVWLQEPDYPEARSVRGYDQPAKAEAHLRTFKYNPHNPPEIVTPHDEEHDAPSQSTPTPTPASVESEPQQEETRFTADDRNAFMKMLKTATKNRPVKIVVTDRNSTATYSPHITYTAWSIKGLLPRAGIIIETAYPNQTEREQRTIHPAELRLYLERANRVITPAAYVEKAAHEPLGANLDRDLGY